MLLRDEESDHSSEMSEQSFDVLDLEEGTLNKANWASVEEAVYKHLNKELFASINPDKKNFTFCELWSKFLLTNDCDSRLFTN